MSTQPYLKILYKAIFALAYYGLMRVGEVSQSLHNLKSLNIHIAENKNKIMCVLYSSKMHSKASRPQEVKISSSESTGYKKRFFCPFNLIRSYIQMRGDVKNENEAFFVYTDRSAVTASALRKVLQRTITNINLNPAN